MIPGSPFQVLRLVPVPSITKAKLESEIDAVFSENVSEEQLDNAGVSESDFKSASRDDVRLEQKAGFAVEPIVITIGSKIAYDIWERLILPRLVKKYGDIRVAQVKRAP